MAPRLNHLPFKRKHYRMSVHFPVEFQVIKFQDEQVSHLATKKGIAVAQDVAESGLSFVSPLRLPVDMIVAVNFYMNDLGEFRELAKVVRSRVVGQRYLTGLQFINFGGVRRDKLRNFIAGEFKKRVKLIKYL